MPSSRRHLSTLFTLLFLIGSLGVTAQLSDVKKLLNEGIILHDKGDFSGAITKFEKALDIDPDNVLAWYEMGLSYEGLGNYSKAIEICKSTISKHKKSDKLEGLYTLQGNCFDKEGKTKEALKVYKAGMKKLPASYLLPFNMGVTLLRAKDYEGAQESFEKALNNKQNHASSHYYLAIVSDQAGNKIPTILAITHFLILKPSGERAEKFLPVLYQRTSSNVSKSSDNQITINLDAGAMEDKGKENNFSSVELIMSLTAATLLTDDGEKLTQLQKLQKQFDLLISSMESVDEKSRKGFFWEEYAAFFIQLKKDGHLEAMVHVINSGDPKEAAAKLWVENNKEKVKAFYIWMGAYYQNKG